MSAIDTDNSFYHSSPPGCEQVETDSEDEYIYVHAQCGLEQFAFFGPNLQGIPKVSENIELFSNASSLLSYLATLQAPTEPANTADVLELCNCRDNTGRIAARISHRHGRVDALAEAHFSEAETQQALATYYRHSPPAMIVLASCCLLYTSPSPRDLSTSRMPSSA